MTLIIEKINNKLFCLNCDRKTVHTPKLSASLEGKAVCTVCSSMNGVCTLIGSREEIKTSNKVIWIEFDEFGRAKKTHKKIGVNRSLVMSPFNGNLTWITTLVKQIIEEKPNYVKFKTENTLYKLYFHDFIGIE